MNAPVRIAVSEYIRFGRVLPWLVLSVSLASTYVLWAYEHEYIAYSGSAISLLLALITWLLVHSRTLAIDATHALDTEGEKSRMLLQIAGDGIYVLDHEGRLTLSNAALCRMLGYSNDEMRSMDVAQWNKKWTRAKVKAKIAELLIARESIVFETRFSHRDGHLLDVEVNAVGVHIGDKPMLYCSVRDISQRRENEAAQRLAATVFNTVDEAVLVIDLQGRILTVNPAFTVITGYSMREVAGKSLHMLTAEARETNALDPARAQPDELWQTLSQNGNWQGEMEQRRKSGAYYLVSLSIKRVNDDQDKPSHYVAVFSDISARKASELHLSHLAHYDGLTELPNRILFGDRLQQALTQARRERTGLALVYLDLDNFKPINDSYGHNTGDLLLKEVARRMQECKRESDTVSRMGGDEFIMLLPSIETEQDAVVVAEKILLALSQPFALDEHVLQLSASIGIAIYPEHGYEEKQLVRNADIAMYHAKRNGRNNVMLYHHELLENPQ